MSAKKNTPPTTSSGDLPALKIGSRVRCSDDGVTGRIAWANAVSVKIKWDDGEEITWRRDSLASRPIAILDADAATGAEQSAAAVEPATAAAPQAPAQVATIEPTEPAMETVCTASEQVIAAEVQTTDTITLTVSEQAAETPATAPAPMAPEPTADAAPALAIFTPTPTAAAQPKRQAKTLAEPKEKKLSALDAAARVLAEAGQAMTCKEMIAVMAAKGYWTSPGGQTPDATLYSAILRELSVKGADARFQKTERGQFGRTEAR